MAVTLDDLRKYVGAVSTQDDPLLQNALDASQSWIEDRVYPSSIGHADVDQATLLLASKFYKRRQSPEGVAGFSGTDIVVRIASNDPDVRALLERHNDMGGTDVDGNYNSSAIGIG